MGAKIQIIPDTPKLSSKKLFNYTKYTGKYIR